MYNWSTDKKELKKDPQKYAIWRLEQLINYGLSGEKIEAEELRKLWNLIDIDLDRRKFLDLLLNEK